MTKILRRGASGAEIHARALWYSFHHYRRRANWLGWRAVRESWSDTLADRLKFKTLNDACEHNHTMAARRATDLCSFGFLPPILETVRTLAELKRETSGAWGEHDWEWWDEQTARKLGGYKDGKGTWYLIPKGDVMSPVLGTVERCPACRERGASCIDPCEKDRRFIELARNLDWDHLLGLLGAERGGENENGS